MGRGLVGDALRIQLFAPLMSLYNFPTFPFSSSFLFSTSAIHLVLAYYPLAPHILSSLDRSTTSHSFRSLTLLLVVSILKLNAQHFQHLALIHL